MSKLWYPVINLETCSQCGACVGKCTHDVYEKNTTTPSVIYPEGCVDGCHGCQVLCPTNSISYVGEGTSNTCQCGGV